MSVPKYSINDERISTLLTWVRSGEIAIPEIQRPFVWKPIKVRDLLDSLLQGYPVGYMIVWRNADVKLKDGSRSAGKRILIDGQQRMTALMAALLGYEIVDNNYRKRRIRIAYHPIDQRFEVLNSAIRKDPAWVPDITELFAMDFKPYKFVNSYCERHPHVDHDEIHESVTNLLQITNHSLGIIELLSSLDIETVTEIFIRVNSEGVPLSQADFAMSKIAVNEDHGGTLLRKAIDYFCHLAVAPEFYSQLEKNDKTFVETEYFRKMAWLRNANDDLYDPSYTDMLRVSFTSEFRRGRLEDLVALLSGRNFETREYEEIIVEDTFNRLNDGIMKFMNETHFQRFIMIIRSAGFIDSSMIGSQNAMNFAYILYLMLRSEGVDNADIERYVRLWYVMSVLTGRYSSSPESTFDQDIRLIDEIGIENYSNTLIRGQLSDAFWETTLPQQMIASTQNSPSFQVFRAAQVKLNDRGFLSRDITVRELIEYKSDVHHIFPRDFLKRAGMTKGQYNQIANYVMSQSEINIAIGNKAPTTYFTELLNQCNGGARRYGNITDINELSENLDMNCIPEGIEHMTVDDYPDFLQARRQLMAEKIKTYFESL
ncbi:MAG: DUF262 domain-containing protein [Chloroflexi bacterium]|nr:DUF262 domain-containing protein [Chloroflexota bacterium]